MKYHIVHLGCQMNQSDAERIRTVIETMGYAPTEQEEEADLLGIVACSVRQKAIDKVYSKIHLWNSWKKKRSILTFVSGCILPADREKFLDRFDLLFGIEDLPDLPNMIAQYGVHTPFSGRFTAPTINNFWNIRPSYKSDFEAFIPIQNGCDKFCTFCAVPYTRGREVSRPSAEILDEVAGLIEKGYRSITLLGQNVNSYGQDKRAGGSEIGFPELMRRVGELARSMERESDFWVYFTSPHPRDMTTELLEVIAEYPCLAKQIHLPLQSGDDKVLIRMNRNHSIERYRAIVADVRRILPSATLFTDIIVGFTGETEEQFQNTCAAMEEFRYNMAYIAQYSPRPGATSSRWVDDVPQVEKKRRLRVLSDILHRRSFEYNEGLLGREFRVLIEGIDRTGKYLAGRTEGKLPIRIPRPEGVAADAGARIGAKERTSAQAGAEAKADAVDSGAGAGLIGSFVRVQVTSVSSLSLEGRALIPEAVHA